MCAGTTVSDNAGTPEDEAGTLQCPPIDTASNPPPYTVAETLQAGWISTTPNPQVFSPLQPTVKLEFGNVRSGEIRGHKWNDLNGDGIGWDDQNLDGLKDAAEPWVEPPVVGVEICALSLSGSGASFCTSTDASGDYVLPLPPGVYQVIETLPPLTVQTHPFEN